MLARLAADLIEARSAEQALREADRRKDTFLATLAHELRGPLSPICNALEVLNRSVDNPTASHWARDVMQRQLSQMVQLVDDLLDLNRITQDKIALRRQPVALRTVIDRGIEGCRPLLDARGHELNVAFPPDPIHVHADPVRLAQVFSNLVHNACKFTDPNGVIHIGAELAGDHIVVRVRDSGIGIPHDALGSVFNIFSQATRSSTQKEGGLGIGLYLVKRLVELHDGTVAASSAGPGLGSEFVVRLPALHERPATQQAPVADAVGGVPCRVLVVDDNVDSASSLAMLLQLGGHDVHTAHDPQAALQAAEALRPDCLLLDIGLPGMNGYEVCRILRASPWAKDALVVAVSGWGQEEDRRRSREAGFDHHLVKPVDYQALTDLILRGHAGPMHPVRPDSSTMQAPERE